MQRVERIQEDSTLFFPCLRGSPRSEIGSEAFESDLMFLLIFDRNLQRS